MTKSSTKSFDLYTNEVDSMFIQKINVAVDGEIGVYWKETVLK